MKSPIRVCIMHDHRLFFDAVRKMLRQQDTFAVVNPASDTHSLKLPHLDNGSPPFDIALIDATMDNPDAISTTRDCKQLFPLAKAIIIGLEPCETAILQAIEAGANGYTVKDASCSELLYTIQAVHDGQTPCSPRIAALVFARIAELAQQHNRCAPEPTVRVTSRECEILQLLAHGCHNAEIAHQLGITLHTVKNHVHHILEKFQARGRREVIQRAYQHGMLTRPRPSRVPLAQSWV